MSDKPKKKVIRKVLIIINFVIIAIIMAVGIYVGYLYHKANSAIQRVAAPRLEDTPTDYIKKESFQPMTFLLHKG